VVGIGGEFRSDRIEHQSASGIHLCRGEPDDAGTSDGALTVT